jgi:hypothetical protein
VTARKEEEFFCISACIKFLVTSSETVTAICMVRDLDLEQYFGLSWICMNPKINIGGSFKRNKELIDN